MSEQAVAPLTDEVLGLDGVWKSYNGPLVLRDVNLSLVGGRVHALVGHNGSGKSTLIKIMAGAERAEPAGAARLDGAPLSLDGLHQHHSDRLHFIHQGLNVIPQLNALENVALGTGYPTRAGLIRWRNHRERLNDLLARIGADLDVRRPVADLLPEHQVVVAVARSMAHWTNPRSVLVIDEATAALPGPAVEQLFRTVRNVADEGAAILFVSHRLDEVMRFADDVTVLRDGQVVMATERRHIDHGRLLDAMLGSHQLTSATSAAAPQPTAGVADALRVRELTTERLRAVSLSVHRGEILGVAGLDGSGREELANAIYGAVRRATGEVLLNDRPVRGRPADAVRAGIGLVPGDRARAGVVPELTVRENETLPRLKRYRGPVGLLDAKRERLDVASHLDGLGMSSGTSERQIKLLSGGNQQKIVISRWLRHGVDVLLLDEPVQGIDVGAKEMIFDLVRAAARQGTAVLVCSAVDEDLAALCHRVLVLDRGAIGTELRPPELSAARIGAASHAVTTHNNN